MATILAVFSLGGSQGGLTRPRPTRGCDMGPRIRIICSTHGNTSRYPLPVRGLCNELSVGQKQRAGSTEDSSPFHSPPSPPAKPVRQGSERDARERGALPVQATPRPPATHPKPKPTSLLRCSPPELQVRQAAPSSVMPSFQKRRRMPQRSSLRGRGGGVVTRRQAHRGLDLHRADQKKEGRNTKTFSSRREAAARH